MKYILEHLLALTSLTVVELNDGRERFDQIYREIEKFKLFNTMTSSQLNNGDSLKKSGKHYTLTAHKNCVPFNMDTCIAIKWTTSLH